MLNRDVIGQLVGFATQPDPAPRPQPPAATPAAVRCKTAATPRPAKAAKPATPAAGAGQGTPGTCRVCGCTDEMACPEGCFWLDPSETICSACGTVDADGQVVERAAGQKAAKKRPGAKPT